MWSRAATVGVAVLLFAGCGSDAPDAPVDPEPSTVDRANAAAATITAADIEGLSASPGQKFAEKTLVRECRAQGVDSESCVCSADAILSEVSAVEFALIGIQGTEKDLRSVGDAFSEAILACRAGHPPGDLGLRRLGGQSVEITPETLRRLIPSKKRMVEIAVNSCVRDTGDPEAACQCVSSGLRADFDPYEVGVLSFSPIATREVTPYLRAVIEGCGVDL